MTVQGLEVLHGKPMEPPSIPADYIKSGALSRLPLFFFQELKVEFREAPCLSTIIPTLTDISPNTKSQLTLSFHREKVTSYFPYQEDFTQKREMIFVCTWRISQPSPPSIIMTPHLNGQLKKEPVKPFLASCLTSQTADHICRQLEV